VELGDEGRTDGDHRAAHDQGAEDAPEKDPVLIDGRHGEETKDHRDDKDIVDAQGFLHHISGQIFDGGGPAAVGQTVNGINGAPQAEPVTVVGMIDEKRKGQAEGNPDRRPAESLLHLYDMGLAVKNAQVESEHGQNEHNKSGPEQEHPIFLTGY